MSNLASITGAIPEQLLNGRFLVVGVLNNTGWGRTYIAIDNHQPNKPKCSVKHIQPLSNDLDCLQATKRLFDREVQILKTIGHYERVPHLFDYLEVKNAFYLVKEFVPGRLLSEEFSRGQPWSERPVIHLLHEVLEILSFVHGKGILHGDLQPDKIIRRASDNRWVLTGFNALNQVRTQLLAIPEPIGATVALGALGYMAMEQVRGQPRPSSDIYALGMIAIQALTGLHPVQLDEDPRTAEVVWRQQATVSDELAAIVSKMVCYHFTDRYPSARDVLEALQPLISSNLSASLAVAPSFVEPPSDTETVADSTVPQTSSTSTLLDSISSKKITKGTTGIATSLSLGLVIGTGYLLVHASNPFNLSDQGQATLVQAAQTYQAGNLQKAIALAQSIPSNSVAYKEAQAAIVQWRNDWKKAEAQFETAKQALAERQWQTVLQQARRMPNIVFWQQKVQLIAEQAQAKLELEANQLLQQAYNLAANRDFDGARNTLKRIPEGTPAYANVPSKMAEYSQKHQLKADYTLQQAYNQAAEKDFAAALTYLGQVSPDTPAYTTAQQKIAEYTQKHRVRANYLLQKAYNRAVLKDFTGALTYLKQVPTNTPAYEIAQQKIVEYTQKQRFKATTEKETSTTLTAEQPFRLEPFTQSNPDTTQRQASDRILPSSGNLNPGSRLLEVTPQPSSSYSKRQKANRSFSEDRR